MRDLARITIATLMFGLTATGTSASEAADKTHAVRGKVVRTDGSTGQVVLKTNDGKKMAFTATPKAQFSIDGRPAYITDLKPDQRVRVTYTVADGTQQVLTVRSVLETDEQMTAAIKGSLRKAKEYTYDRRHEYAADLRDVVDNVDDRIDDLEYKLKNADTDEAKKNIRKRIDDLESQRGKLSSRLDKVKDVSADAWDDLKNGTTAAFEDLGRLFDSDQDN